MKILGGLDSTKAASHPVAPGSNPGSADIFFSALLRFFSLLLSSWTVEVKPI